MENKIQFKISSALKNIIGKELITDELIAVFELVKNSYDAHADMVDIFIDKNKIIVKDNGKGMSIDDIKNKWLFVGYSAKADGSEDNDYRAKINKRKSFAGAKGIGRFACDRLGKKISLISIKKEKNTKVEQIEVDWELFEKDPKEEFVNINAVHNTLRSNPYPKIKYGTVLEIFELRNEWNDERIKELKQSLAKLINPIKEKNNDFKIYVNGERIENFIFEKLSGKTTQITTKISADGKFITTELIDRGERIYKIKENNKEEWLKTLSGIDFSLFHLNFSAKIFFKKRMGMSSVEFGSVFLYKSGIRVYPYGEEGEDTLKIDRRKQQGVARFLGTRELIGYIKINNTSDQFKETSSRDGGLIDTQAYRDLKDCFFKNCLRRLEVYVVDTMDWTYIGKNEDGIVILPEQRKGEITTMIKKLTKAKDFVELDYSYVLLDKLGERAKKGLSSDIGKFKEEALKSNNEILIKKSEDIYNKFTKLSKAKEEAEDERNKLEEKIGKKNEQVSSLMRLTTQEFKNVVSYHHQIGICSDTIRSFLNSAVINLRKSKLEKVEELLQKIRKENDKISSISGFASRKSGMGQSAIKQKAALDKFIESYLKNDYSLNDGLEIILNNNLSKDFICSFRTFDITMILDNLLNNSKKAAAKKIDISLRKYKNNLELEYFDDGNGLDRVFNDSPEEIFDPKTSTTNGSGWGLYCVKEVLNEMNSEIIVSPQRKGIRFLITFKV